MGLADYFLGRTVPETAQSACALLFRRLYLFVRTESMRSFIATRNGVFTRTIAGVFASALESQTDLPTVF